ncbi:MAG: hypothetical protein HY296_05800 [Thaumarchaeota archaeon]|nr:hypothetical protein [Nitrososphaerota archaeon]
MIELCKSVERSSANPFDVDIREKIMVLKKRLPEWKFLDELLLDSEAMLELAQIVKLQDEWLKHRASSLYIDPLLIQLKVKVLPKDALVESFVRSWHPIVQVDQISPKGLEKAFVYWRDLGTMSERFKDEFGTYGVRPGTIGYEELIELGVFTGDEFDKRLKDLMAELAAGSNGEWIDYRAFIHSDSFEQTVLRAYLLAFLISDGKASLRTDPLTGNIWTMALREKAGGVPKSVAISVIGEA